ncbi:FliG C-terminal domain-containing protein [Amnibacterium sp.]|uniref:flagellar motor switch protein FliG n=1 Tax=Amnibacterium sp. TaxID=1872496 RepID=UPI00263A038D|nr:FliG C-terminal domain-containing protein [Amnibacterium sp.]MCU1473809.1 flagellar motor switch protein FliG [Amnibacterium sp.]
MTGIGTDFAPVAVRSLSGVQKAALVLMNMSTERAAAVLRNFSPDEAEEITAEMARMRAPAGRDAETAIREFHEQNVVRNEPSGGRTGKDIAADLIHASFEPERAAGLLERIEAPEASVSFAFLESVEAPAVGKQLAGETAETVAFVLVQLGPDQAAKVLMALEPDRRTDVAEAIATMGSPAPEAGGIVADALRRQLRASTSRYAPVAAAGAPGLRVQPLVDIMNRAEPAAEGELMAALQARDAHLAEEVRAKLLAFEDLPRLKDLDLQQVLRGIDIGQLALALKGAGDDIADAVRANMSERNRETLAAEAAELGRVPRSKVDEARHAIVRALRELAGTTGLELKPPAGEGPAEGDAPAEIEDEEEYVD